MIIQVENQQNFNRVQRSISVQNNKTYQQAPIYPQMINQEASQPKNQPQTIKVETLLLQQNQRVNTVKARGAQSQSFYRQPIQYFNPPQPQPQQYMGNNQQSQKVKGNTNFGKMGQEILSQSIIVFNVEELKQKTQILDVDIKSVLEQIKDPEMMYQKETVQIKDQQKESVLIDQENNKSSEKNIDPSINELIEKYLPIPPIQITQIRDKYKQERHEYQEKVLPKDILQESNFQFRSPVVKNYNEGKKKEQENRKDEFKSKVQDEQIDEILQKYQKNKQQKQKENNIPLQKEQTQSYQSHERKCHSNPPKQPPLQQEKKQTIQREEQETASKFSSTSRNIQIKIKSQIQQSQILLNNTQLISPNQKYPQFKLSAPKAIQQYLKETPTSPKKDSYIQNIHEVQDFSSASSLIFPHDTQKTMPKVQSQIFSHEQIRKDQSSSSQIFPHDTQKTMPKVQSQICSHEQIRKDQSSQWVQIGQGAQLWVVTSKGEWVRSMSGEWIKIDINFQYKNLQGKIMTKKNDQVWSDENGNFLKKSQKGEWVIQDKGQIEDDLWIKFYNQQKWQRVPRREDVWMRKNEELYVLIGKNWLNVEIDSFLKEEGKVFRRTSRGWEEDNQAMGEMLDYETHESDEDSKVMGELFMGILQNGEEEDGRSMENARIYLHSKNLNKDKLKLRKNQIYERFDKFFKEILN